MEKLELKTTKDKDGNEVYTLKPQELAEIIQRATLAGQAASSAPQQEEQSQPEIDPLAELAGGM